MESFYTKILEIYSMLNGEVSIDEFLDHIFEKFTPYVPYERVGISLTDIEGNIRLYTLRATQKQKYLLSGQMFKISNTSLGAILKTKKPRIINDYEEYMSKNPKSSSVKLILEEGVFSSIAYPLIVNDVSIGIVFFSSGEKGVYTEEHLERVKLIANSLAISIEKNLLVDELILTSINGFAKLVEAKDCETGLHIERMQNYSKILARTLSKSPKYKYIIDEQFINDIYKFSPLHDIGKIGIAEGILLKPGKLTYEEFEVMKKHTEIGASVLKKASNNLLRRGKRYFEMAIQIAQNHHEKYNGKGYPKGISGEDIPLAARIVAVADVFDALTSKRVYKNMFDIDSSLKMIESEKGKSYDPVVVEALMLSKKEILRIHEEYTEAVEIRV